MTSVMVRVVVAPGRRVQVDPHPSGLAGIGPLYVAEGEGLTVSETVAERLYDRGQVLHPETGQLRPAQAFGTPPLVTNSSETFESMAARAELERTDLARPNQRTVALDSWAQETRRYDVEDPATTEQRIDFASGPRHQW